MEKASEGVASPDPLGGYCSWLDNKSDDDDDASLASSHFSSCEGSEFERYCSANSVLGTASICSSSGNHGDFLDSFRSFGPGEDSLAEGSSVRDRLWRNQRQTDDTLSGKFDGFSDWEGDSRREDSAAEIKFPVSGSDGPPTERTSSNLFLRSNQNGDNYLIPSGVRVGRKSQHLRMPSHGNALESSCSSSQVGGPRADPESSEKLNFCFQGSILACLPGIESVPDENSSVRYEHSEGEGSVLDYGSDGEDDICMNWNSNFNHKWEGRHENENPLLMTSSVAFGNDDWDEFERETEVIELDSIPLHRGKGDRFEVENNICELQDDGPIQRFNPGRREQEYVGDKPEASSQVLQEDKSTGNVAGCHVGKLLIENRGLTVQSYSVRAENSVLPGVHVTKSNCNVEKDAHYISKENVASVDGDGNGISGMISTTCLDNSASQFNCVPTGGSENKEIEPQEENRVVDVLPEVQNNRGLTDIGDMDVAADQVEKYETSELYHEMVLEMEEILLDSGESAGARISQGDRGGTSQKSYHFRDGSSTASTSGTDDIYMGNQYPVSIDWIEVVGAKQKKGDVSFGERLVGVKEYTIYILRVKSGKDQWEVERRYRDFLTLYHQLKTLFTDHGLTLPSPWNSVVRESRNLFGNSSPSVISQRSILIQDCLSSVLQFRFSSGTPCPLIWFLYSNRVSPRSDPLNQLDQNPQKISADVKSNSSYYGEPSADDVSNLGKTISLVLEVKVRKPMGQLLEAQRYLCAGCHRRLDAGKTLVQGLAKTFGWEKNRFCEYTGQLFCFICHTNDAAILPARVLHHWDFSLYSVSQLAKAFLDSIYDQPMLCVSAVNPFLFSKVPALQQIMGIRKRIASMLPYVRCPFRRSINRGLGSRRYLLEDNDFFALRDLTDLSRGAFSALPTLVETVEKKILTHIAQQCLICYDSGIPCAARQSCEDPSSLIFPFQEAEAVRCSSCHLLFHQPCILKMGSCPCGKLAPVDGQLRPASRAGRGADIELKGFVDAPAESSDAKALSGFFADLVSKARPEKLWKKTRKTHPVILMGPLPGTEG